MPLPSGWLCAAEFGKICVCLFCMPRLRYKAESSNPSRFPYCTQGGCKAGECFSDYLLTNCSHSLGSGNKSGGPVFTKTL